MAFNFVNQKKAGDSGEELFRLCYSKLDPAPADNLSYDFNSNIGKIEVKTDTYSMSKTQNFFLERYGCGERKTNGGPWRAQEDKVDFFVYLFVNDLTFFWFEPDKLCSFLDKNVAGMKMKEIQNKTWVTMGYAFPREKCAGLYKSDSFEQVKGKYKLVK